MRMIVMQCALVLTAMAITAAQADDHRKGDRGEFKVRSSLFQRQLDVADFKDVAGNVTHLQFTTGIGSGAFHFPGDDRHTFYTVSDRGVNIKCDEDIEMTGKDICATGKIFPVPGYTPTIFKLEQHGHDNWTIVQAVQLKDASGNPISGLPNPLVQTDTEQAYDSKGSRIAPDPNGLDTEALVRLSDGSFWVSDEYAPSLVHVAADGKIIERLVPAGIESDLAGATYPIRGTLPGILARRKLNRGIESVAVSPDESYLYFSMQSPLANPDKSAYKGSRNVRLFKMDLEHRTLVGEYIYVIDLPETFLDDSTGKQSKVKVSEMAAYAEDRLLVLERVNNTTKLYRVHLDDADNILGSRWDNGLTSPSLEQATDLSSAGINPLGKDPALDSATDLVGTLPAKVEGIAIMGNNELVLVNDNDFGIAGADTHIVHLKTGHHFFK